MKLMQYVSIVKRILISGTRETMLERALSNVENIKLSASNNALPNFLAHLPKAPLTLSSLPSSLSLPPEKSFSAKKSVSLKTNNI